LPLVLKEMEGYFIRLFIIVLALGLADLRLARLKRPNYIDLLSANTRYGGVFGLELIISFEVLS
jgi:hypothetical protein